LQHYQIPNDVYGKFLTSDYSIPIMNISNFTSLSSLTSLRKLKLNYLDEVRLNFFDILKTFKNLKKLYIYRIINTINNNQTTAIQSFLLNDLQQFECVSLPKESLINCFQIQKNYPNIRFRWYLKNEKEVGIVSFDIYEGNFSVRNEVDGKGVCLFASGDRYDGEWKNGNYEGRTFHIC
jgi:hypothetical protein